MRVKFLILLHFFFHCTYGSDVSKALQQSKPTWFKIVRTKRANRVNQTPEITPETMDQSPKEIIPEEKVDQTLETVDQKQKRKLETVGFGEKFRLEDLRGYVAEHFKNPLPEKLILKKTYDFFDGVPKKLRYFTKNFLNFPDFQDGVEIITSPGWLDNRGHVTEGQIGNIKVVLKRSKDWDDPNEREMFYKFMDTAKEKLMELATIVNDYTLSEEEKKLRTQKIQNQLIGLGNIVSIVGITQIQRPDTTSPEKCIDETIEILPKVNGHTLYDCIKKSCLPMIRLEVYPEPQILPSSCCYN
ncbi:MAG: hypothetical protein LBF34_03365 [Puniceicoccales bacterium]|jgi:hypothetical protein|nr:hypothetical protein [Puniceicoccales bacterium]